MIEKAESQDRTICLIMITYPGLRPGFMYLFRTRGLNVAGAGPWSQETYSVSANCALHFRIKKDILILIIAFGHRNCLLIISFLRISLCRFRPPPLRPLGSRRLLCVLLNLLGTNLTTVCLAYRF